jgi:phosphate/sulfate permease
VIKYYYQQIQITTEIYRYMMVFSAALMCLSHGSNDVANGISPLLVVMRQEQNHDNWSKLIGSIGITMGLLIFGRLVMESVGKEIVVLDFQKGFASQFSTAAAVTLGSSLGIPLSTTHCMIGSLAGVYFGGKMSPVKKIYWRKEGQVSSEEDKEKPTEAEGEGEGESAEVLDEASKVNFGTVKKILFWWGITIPCAFGFTFVLCKIIV